MFLKNLDIFGFKSFADRTRVDFADGITALLGPNGCGKSNVVDAIKWVLGEQASRAMRAEKMEDVIFNGTENRKALNVAEVALTIENESGRLPMDVAEIQIKRRLYRSGESEYFINSTPVKLKEIRELFWDTGVGKAAYSVMEQGKIDQVLSSKPDERRYLFEEAAGITRFKVKSAEAERKLAKTEENMRQVEGILGEVKRSYDSLKVQADKTLKYRSLREEIFQFELDIQLLRLKQFKYERDERNENLKRRTEERDTIRSDIDAVSKSLEENMDVVNSMEETLIQYQKDIYGLAVEKNAREKEARLFAEQRADTKAAIQQNESRERAIGIKIEELTEDAEEQDGVVRDLQKKVHDIEANITGFEESVQAAASRIGENDSGVRQSEEEIRNLEKERGDHEKALEAITDDIVAALDAGLREAGYSAAERRSTEASLEETLGFLRTLLAGRETLLRDLAAAAERSAAGDQLPSSAELKRIAEGLAAALGDAAAYGDKVLALFESYRKSTPSFIDEFLAPEGIITKKRSLDTNIRAANEGITGRRSRIAGLRQDNENLNIKIDEYRATLEELRIGRARMTAQAQAAEEQSKLIRRELAGQEGLLKTVQDELFLGRKRFDEINERIADTESELAEIEQKGLRLTADLEKLEKDISKKNGDVAGKQETIKKRTADLAKVQATLERIHLELVQSETEIKNIQDNFRETHSRDLMEFEERIFTITTPAAELRDSLSQARNKLKDLGSVNLMAPEEFAETKERYEFLSSQMADLTKARDDLEAITKEIKQESSDLFIATYNKIKKNFHNMFRRLFGGGKAELRLVDPNHVLESGIEIYAQPPGKKLENITLLSGGEKSMTAVALLFATYMVKPSPFCLLDEIDAALDEQNVIRFVQLLREFGSTSQFIVITHNKKTVTGAETLLGVTMEESGITKVISVKLKNEELAVTPEPDKDTPLFEEEDVEPEEGRELPIGINDPALVSEAELRPIRAGAARSVPAADNESH
ncbi:chromosome segregation protein SMC [Treponema primitia ZAS-2]|uniref:Chromosome partition protein Smc n=1 Tax=Treponema primitia (strain ATCC BAA-887 / DSM 12427 / ZAS-2) TaxID=545694 RepID=F5YN93_TREPZ|nr:AAA family ATPase [Treponema primitia]AEF84048.1 chromosome segregation protein SMC [Treponema primitia ZAS-2]